MIKKPNEVGLIFVIVVFLRNTLYHVSLFVDANWCFAVKIKQGKHCQRWQCVYLHGYKRRSWQAKCIDYVTNKNKQLIQMQPVCKGWGHAHINNHICKQHNECNRNSATLFNHRFMLVCQSYQQKQYCSDSKNSDCQRIPPPARYCAYLQKWIYVQCKMNIIHLVL